MMEPSPVRAGIVGLAGRPIPALLSSLGAAMEVQFEERDQKQLGGLHGVILLGGSPAEAGQLRKSGIPCLHYPEGEAAVAEKIEREIHFGDAPELPQVLRGRVLRNRLTSGLAMKAIAGATVLARADAVPFWTTCSEGGSRFDCCLLPLPSLADGQGLFDHLNARSFTQLLPVLEFLKLISGDARWQQPPLRACFMFDDPNLHWTSYGCIDYRELVQHARANKYHVAFATIPLDYWLVHPPTAKLFRENTKHLSLLIHGNNHTQYELARSYSAEERTALLRQAIQRIERLEARSGCRVSRVMAAPHGACSEAMMGDMARVGFEAACISHGSLRFHNPGKPWGASVGYRMGEMVAGLPILTRFALAKDCRNAVLLCALLNQPIIPMGHHQDVAGGLDLLGEVAGFINSLGAVEWMDMQSIARSNYRWRSEAELLRVKMFARRVKVAVPPEARRLAVDRLSPSQINGEEICWRLSGTAGQARKAAEASTIPSGVKGQIECFLASGGTNGCAGASRYPLPMWGLARRLLSETRDRALAIRPRIKKTV